MVRVTTKHAQIGADSPANIEAWLRALSQTYPASEFEVIEKACDVARQAHRGQKRASGEPFFFHSLAVAGILAELRLDYETIAAAILHDVVEDTEVTLKDVREQFGKTISDLVDGVTKMDLIQGIRTTGEPAPREHAHAENLRKMLLAMAADVRVVLIKLADRLHNMRTLGSLPEHKQQRIASETMEILAPLANRLGIWQIKWELEDLSFRYLKPGSYKQIASSLKERRIDRERYIENFVGQLQTALEIEGVGVKAEVKGRAKHIYGIWKKMRHKNQDFHEIYDVLAVRVLVDSIPDCYAVLGTVHTLWQYLPGEFDDYIATPKENNYRSIHTAVIGPSGKTVEVQIRTRDMNQESEYGVAAHWRYKENAKSDESFDSKIAWLRQLLDWKDEVAEASEFVDQFKSEVFADRVYVFTPLGNVIDLPRNATPLDFAYQIHTEVGNRCRGAKVNGHIVPLTYKLQTGEKVEVLTVKNGGPSRDWLNPHLGYIKSPKARSQIQRWFRLQNYEHNVAEGRTMLERELKRMGYADVSFEKIARKLKQKNVDDMMAAIGRGDIKPSRAVRTASELTETRGKEEPITPIVRDGSKPGPPTGIRVQGVGDLLTRFAGCCKPVPGDPITGYITRGKGVTIHRQDCHNILNAISDNPERLVEVDWGGKLTGTYRVDIEILAFDRHGLMRDITTQLANETINVIAINTETNKDSNTAYMVITAEVPDIDTLSMVLARINLIPNVTEVRRKSN
ncbi:MAG: GTP diphosphokinase [Acidiferrobacterales bacterium]